MKTKYVRAMLAASSVLGLAFAASNYDIRDRVNAAPAHVVDNDQATTSEGQPVSVNVLANDHGMGAIRTLRVHVPPRHGSARVVNSEIVYTPAPGYSGKDHFRYYIKGARGFGTAAVSIDVLTDPSLALVGRVAGGQSAFATVTAKVGALAFSTEADASGDFRVEISSPVDAMVTLSARGLVPSIVSYRSVVGEYEQLRVQAGSDNELTRDENNQVQITGIGTAQSHLVQLNNHGQLPTNDAQFTRARERVHHGDMLARAVAIHLAVRGDYPLPQSVNDTFTLISDDAALQAFFDSIVDPSGDVLEDASRAVLFDPGAIVPANDGTHMLGDYSYPGNFGAPGTVVSANVGMRIELDPDGSGRRVGGTRNVDPSTAWTIEGGIVTAVSNSPAEFVSWPFISGVQVREVWRFTHVRISKLFDGDGRDTWGVESIAELTYPDNPEIPTAHVSATGAGVAVRDDRGLPFSEADIVGLRSLGAVVPPGLVNWYVDLFDFDADGGGVRESGAEFAWELDEVGRLRLTYPQDAQQATYVRISDDGQGGDLVTGEFRDADGAYSTSTQLSVRGDGFEFTPSNVKEEWHSGYYISSQYFPANGDLAIVVEDAPVAWHASYSPDGELRSRSPLGWTLANGVLSTDRYVDNGSYVHFCNVQDEDCYIEHSRRWRPIAKNGNRLYVIEELYGDNGEELELGEVRPNFYDAPIEMAGNLRYPKGGPKAAASARGR